MNKVRSELHAQLFSLCSTLIEVFQSDCAWRVQTVLEQGGQFAGINRKVQLKPIRWSNPSEDGSSEPPRILEALLILKHGGVLTHAGREQVRHCVGLYRYTWQLCSTGTHGSYAHACS